MNTINRRTFLETTSIGLPAAALATAGATCTFADFIAPEVELASPLKETYRAAAIGSTGRGDFGHGIDLALVNLPGVKFVAIADNDPQGRKAAGERCKVEQLYGDYRKMLDEEQLDLVCVGMRHVDQHEEVLTHCAQAGKHLYCEKPVAADMASFDRITSACDRHGVKLAVALPNRVSPAVRQALAFVRDGRIGKLRSLRARGKSDRRGGGEDLMVLGYHMLDLMCMFAGQPMWTFANVLRGKSDAMLNDARHATEPIGPIAGDCVAAMFGFSEQVHGYFDSHHNEDSDSDRFSLEVYGSHGTITMRSLADVMLFDGSSYNPAKRPKWQPISVPQWDALPNKYHWCHQRLLHDLLKSVEDDREPVSCIHNTRWTQEMIQSVYVSHLARSRTDLPLPADKREHPLK